MMPGVAATARVAGIAVTLASLYACTPSSVTVSWAEDVKLGNGQVVTVERKETSHTAGQWGQGTEYYLTAAGLRARNGATWLTTEWSAPAAMAAMRNVFAHAWIASGSFFPKEQASRTYGSSGRRTI